MFVEEVLLECKDLENILQGIVKVDAKKNAQIICLIVTYPLKSKIFDCSKKITLRFLI